MQAYKPYIDYLTSGGVSQTAYILTREGVICATNLPIQQLPQYNFALVDDNNPDITHNVVVDQRSNLIEALGNKGVAKNKAGIRLYNQKYYTVNYQAAEGKDKIFTSLYLKKEKGGACICVTKTFIIIGSFNTAMKMQNGVPQNPGELNKRVEDLAKDLASKGY